MKTAIPKKEILKCWIAPFLILSVATVAISSVAQKSDKSKLNQFWALGKHYGIFMQMYVNSISTINSSFVVWPTLLWDNDF